MNSLISAVDASDGSAVLMALLTLVCIQCALLFGPGTRRERNAFQKDIQSVCLMWLGAQLCGVILRLAGFPLSISVAATFAVGVTCAAPPFCRAAFRALRAVPWLYAVLRTSLMFIGRTFLRTCVAIFNFANRPDSYVERLARRTMLAAVSSCAAALTARLLMQQATGLGWLADLPVIVGILMAGIITLSLTARTDLSGRTFPHAAANPRYGTTPPPAP